MSRGSDTPAARDVGRGRARLCPRWVGRPEFPRPSGRGEAGLGVAALAQRLRGTGVDQTFLEEIRAQLRPGTSALVVLSGHADLAAHDPRIRPVAGEVTREVTATGTTKAAAERALREKLVDRATPSQQAITADATVAKLASLWLTYLRDEGRIEATTINEYERVLTKVVIPELGDSASGR